MSSITVRIASVIACVFGCSGCGYSTDRPFTDQVRTIHVEMFNTRDFRRDQEYQLTESLVKRIEMDTPYAIAPADTADSVLSGELQEVQQNTLGNDFRTDLPREIGATFVVSYRWKDLRTGRILLERQQFPFTTTYIPPVGENYFEARVRGLDGLAELIVESMESSW